jgi:hypothetical protein
LIIQRSFSCYSPDILVFGANVLHLQCGILVRSASPFVPAEALAVLMCFMSPFECKYNFQLFFMTLLVNDGSFLVRFHFMLLVKTFISSFDAYVHCDPAAVETHTWQPIIVGGWRCIDEIMAGDYRAGRIPNRNVRPPPICARPPELC